MKSSVLLEYSVRCDTFFACSRLCICVLIQCYMMWTEGCVVGVMHRDCEI